MTEGEGSRKWKNLGRRRLLECPLFARDELDNEGPGGRRGRFIVLDAPDWAVVVPLLRQGGEESFLMVRQYRHGSGELSLEFPGGVVEPGEEPEAAVRRELAEETGYRAASIRLAGSVSPNPAIMANRFHVFVAEGLEPTGRTDLDEQRFQRTFGDFLH